MALWRAASRTESVTTRVAQAGVFTGLWGGCAQEVVRGGEDAHPIHDPEIQGDSSFEKKAKEL